MAVKRKPNADRLPVSQRIDSRMANPSRRDRGHIIALIVRHLVHVTRADQFHQPQRIRPLDLNLAFNGHVPNLHMLFQMRSIRLDAFEERRQQHVVVNGKALDPGGLDPR